MRAALLPTPGDPFLLAYWLRNFETWREYVDELVILVNGQTDPETIEYIRSAVPEDARLAFTPSRIGHDGAIDRLLGMTDATHVVLCEDDAYVRHPRKVDESFQLIETGLTDIVGSPRHEDYAGQFQEWGDFDPQDQAEFRHGLWPAFLFVRRADLLATDRVFGDRAWSVGDTIIGLDRVVTPEDCAYVGINPEYIHLDTLFGTTFQLRAKGLRTELVHHVRLFEAKATEDWVREDPPWFHVTGLSTIDYVMDGREAPDLDEHGGLWTRRMAWWLRTWHNASQDIPGHRHYGDRLGSFIGHSGMRTEDISDWFARFDPWVTWEQAHVR